MLLRGAGLDFSSLYSRDKNIFSNNSSFIVTGFLDKLSYDQNENGNI